VAGILTCSVFLHLPDISQWFIVKTFKAYSCGYSPGISPDSHLIGTKINVPKPNSRVKVIYFFGDLAYNKLIKKTYLLRC
tara:strand:+ start:1694 stop:1933 length:240 start_codon:yes stop_codon:yes gene_type:complete